MKQKKTNGRLNWAEMRFLARCLLFAKPFGHDEEPDGSKRCRRNEAEQAECPSKDLKPENEYPPAALVQLLVPTFSGRAVMPVAT